MLEAALAAGVAAGGGHALLGGVLPTPGARAAGPPLRLRPRRGGLRLAQPLPGQRDQVLRPRGHQALDEPRGRDRGLIAGRRAAGAMGRVRELHGGAGDDYLRELELRFRDLDLSGRGCCSTAPTAPPTGSRRRSSAASGPTSTRSPPSPTGATSTPAAARRTSRRCRAGGRWRLRRRASPSTATATACWRSTARAWWWTATS